MLCIGLRDIMEELVVSVVIAGFKQPQMWAQISTEKAVKIAKITSSCKLF